MATQIQAIESFREYLQDVHSDGEFDLSEHGSTLFRAIWHKGELPPIPPVVIRDSYAQSLEQWIEL